LETACFYDLFKSKHEHKQKYKIHCMKKNAISTNLRLPSSSVTTCSWTGTNFNLSWLPTPQKNSITDVRHN